MCKECYFIFGDEKRVPKCKHPNRLIYSKEMCHSCYTRFTKKKRDAVSQKQKNINFISENVPGIFETGIVALLEERDDAKVYLDKNYIQSYLYKKRLMQILVKS